MNRALLGWIDCAMALEAVDNTSAAMIRVRFTGTLQQDLVRSPRSVAA